MAGQKMPLCEKSFSPVVPKFLEAIISAGTWV
jgi:hypothetical protein